SRRRHTRFSRDWSSDVCSSDLERRDDQFVPVERGSLAELANPPNDLLRLPPTKIVDVDRDRRLVLLVLDRDALLEEARCLSAREIGRASGRERMSRCAERLARY